MCESMAAREGVRQYQCGRIRLIVSLLIAAAAIPPALAAEGDENSLQEVTITGSRIRQVTGMTTPVPVTKFAVYVVAVAGTVISCVCAP